MARIVGRCPQPCSDQLQSASSSISTSNEASSGTANTGWRWLTLVARREAPLKELADELAGKHGIRAEVITADLTDFDARTAIATRLAELGLSVSILVNNAGLSTSGPVYRSDPVREVAMIRTDVEAVAHLCSVFLPQMAERRSGGVLNVASTAAFQPLPGQAGYGGSKAFVLSYSHALRAELAKVGVTVTVLCPGPVPTSFGETAGFTKEEAEGSLPKFMWVDPDDVARQTVDGLEKGRRVVIPGVSNRVGAAFGYMLPRRVLLPILSRQHPALRK